MNRSSKLVHGVGVKGNTSVKEGGNFKESYIAWKAMLGRCYYYKQDSYSDCFACEDWLTFSNFEIWFNKNHIEGFELDKDLTVKGSKVYSPETCAFVPCEINNILNVKKKGCLLPGVTKQPNSSTFIARVSKSGKRVYLGAFKTKEEAFQAYKKAKEKHVKTIARKYYESGMITKHIFNTLLNWRLV